MGLPNDLLRVAKDDPDYVRQARAEAEFWERPHPLGLETSEEVYREGPVDHHINERFTGDMNLRWHETIPRHGKFRRGLVLGTSALRVEADILEGNPSLHLTFVDQHPVGFGILLTDDRRVLEVGSQTRPLDLQLLLLGVALGEQGQIMAISEIRHRLQDAVQQP